jgi:hypothetical protein
MIRSVFSTPGIFIRLLLALVLIAGLVFVAFVAYRGSQPIQLAGADGMTCWRFMHERIRAIRELPAKCQQLHFTSFAIAVPLYPHLYTYVGIYPECYLARHTQPDPSIPKNFDWSDAPETWWSLVETVSWETWVIQHLPTTEDTPLEEAARIMADHKIGGLPVVRDGEVVETITETDLFKIFLEMLGAREPGVRLAVLVPSFPDVLARLTQVIFNIGGDLLALGKFLGESSLNWEVTLKVAGVDSQSLISAGEPLVERILDIRELA